MLQACSSSYLIFLSAVEGSLQLEGIPIGGRDPSTPRLLRFADAATPLRMTMQRMMAT